MNFTWWVNRKDPEGRGVFAGGFLGMDNLGVFDRSRDLPVGDSLEQADGTAWMGFYCTSMLRIAFELALHDRAYEDVASKFFEHFVAIADALNNLGGRGLWDEEDGFYYDQLAGRRPDHPAQAPRHDGHHPAAGRADVLDEDDHPPEPAGLREAAGVVPEEPQGPVRHTSACWRSRGRRRTAGGSWPCPAGSGSARCSRYLLDEAEFLSPFGVRSLSQVYKDKPYVFRPAGDGREFAVGYVPGDMDTEQFGGNSNWRGPIWMPVNYLLIEALGQYHEFYGDTFQIECPTGSGTMMNLDGVAGVLGRRLAALFLPREGLRRPCHGTFERFAADPLWKDYVLFHEYFDGDTGRGLGASHQTGWTALVATLIEQCAKRHRG